MTIKANSEAKWLPLYEALASEVRLRILDMLAGETMNVKEIAQRLNLSAAIMTMHIRKLENAGLIDTTRVRREGGTHKLCSLKERSIEIELPLAGGQRPYREQSIPVGHFTAFEIYPTCGLATREKRIGQYDDPRYFLDPERVNAAILWFGRGYVEYKTPNYLLPNQEPVELEISMEISSEAPGVSDNWPSDIRFYFNGVSLGYWTSPGDFGSHSRGRYTPDWWSSGVNQYGLWKTIRVNESGTFIDGLRISDATIADLKMKEHFWTLRYAIEENSEHVGGLTLFGSGFGNYDRDIELRVYYEQAERMTE